MVPLLGVADAKEGVSPLDVEALEDATIEARGHAGLAALAGLDVDGVNVRGCQRLQ
jgi:hypothetical protein